MDDDGLKSRLLEEHVERMNKIKNTGCIELILMDIEAHLRLIAIASVLVAVCVSVHFLRQMFGC